MNTNFRKFSKQVGLCFPLGLWALGAFNAPVHAAMTQADSIAAANALEANWRNSYLITSATGIQTLQTNAAQWKTSLDLATGKWDGSTNKITYPAVNATTGKSMATNLSGWETHLQRTRDLCRAWWQTGTSMHGDASYASSCSTAMEAYLLSGQDMTDLGGYRHPYADLEEGPDIGEILLFGRTNPTLFPQATLDRWSKRTLQGQNAIWPLNLTGVDPKVDSILTSNNILWTSMGLISNALSQSKQTDRLYRLDTLLDNVWHMTAMRWPIRNPIDGFTADGLEAEHEIPYNGGSYASFQNTVNFRKLTMGSPWQSPIDLDTLLINVLLDGIADAAQGQHDIQTAGKDFENTGSNEPWNFAGTYPTQLEGWGYRSDELKAYAAWKPGITAWPFPARSFKSFFTADYATKHYPLHMVSVRGVSSYTVGTETFQALPTCHVFFPLGTSFIYRDGTEYRSYNGTNIWSAFDWARAPGLTTVHVDSNAIRSVWNTAGGVLSRYVYGGTPFAGAVESGSQGLFAWAQSDTVYVDPMLANSLPDGKGTGAKKTRISVAGKNAIFFLDNAVVHLGSGFDVSGRSLPTYASFDQRLSKGATYIGRASGSVKIAQGTPLTGTDIAWAWHDSVGYIPPVGERAVVQDVMQPGNPALQIFSAWADLGSTRKDVTYEWAVVPGIDTAKLAALTRQKSWATLQNDTNVQALYVAATAWTGIAFHHLGTFTAGSISVTVNRPLLITLRETTDSLYLTVADPVHSHAAPGSASLQVNRQLTGATWNGKASTLGITLPTGNLTGSTVSLGFLKVSALSSSSSSKTVSSSSLAASSSSARVSSSAVSSSSLATSSSSVDISSSSATHTTNVLTQNVDWQTKVSVYQVFDVLGHLQFTSMNMPLNLAQGRWIVVARDAHGLALKSWLTGY